MSGVGESEVGKSEVGASGGRRVMVSKFSSVHNLPQNKLYILSALLRIEIRHQSITNIEKYHCILSIYAK